MTNKIILYPVFINILGVVIAILYGVFGSSGGGTTEGFFKILSITGISTILISIIILLIKYSIVKKYWYLILIMSIIGFFEFVLYGWF